MLELVKRVLVAGVAFGVLDYLWLEVVMRTFYRTRLEALLVSGSTQMHVQWLPAFCVYSLLAIGMVLFVVPRASRFLFSSFVWGAVFGLVVYGVYNGTNVALIRQWPVVLAVVDAVWGVILCGLVSVITTAFSSRKGLA